MKKALHENPGKYLQEAEEIAYDELKQKYLSEFVSRYKYLTDLSATLRKDPVNKKLQETATRDEEDYNGDESRLYAIKKRKFLIEKKLNDYDPSSYEGTDIIVCVNVQMCRCANVQMCKRADVQMCRCADLS